MSTRIAGQMGRPRASERQVKFRQEIADKFQAAMKECRFPTQSAAARALGVTRQAFSQYLLRNTTPHPDVLARACTLWKLKLRYGDNEFTYKAFAPAKKIETNVASEPFQLALFDEPQRFENERLVVMLKRSEKATLQVTIRMKKAELRQTRRVRKRRRAV